MEYDGWRYSSEVAPRGHSALACSPAPRVGTHRARGPPAHTRLRGLRPSHKAARAAALCTALCSGPGRSGLAAWLPKRGGPPNPNPDPNANPNVNPNGVRFGACPKPSILPPWRTQAQGAWAWDDGDRVSHLTVLLYLNEGFDGGQTLLHPPAPRRDPSKAQAQAKAQAKAAPPRRSRKQRRRLRRAAAGGPEGGGSEGGIEGAAEGGPEMAAAAESEERPPSVAVTPVAGSALCFGQSFSLGRSNAAQQAEAASWRCRSSTPQPTAKACGSRLFRLLAATRTRWHAPLRA